MDIAEELILTKEQRKAFKSLKNAFDRCEKVGLDIHGSLTTLFAVNANCIDGRAITIGKTSEISDDAEYFTPDCFKGCAADDKIGFQ